MPRGGKRAGAGRKPGSATRKTREIADAAAANGQTPLQYLLDLMRDNTASPERRDKAAELTLGYMHPKISSAPPSPEAERSRPSSMTVNVISIPNGRYFSKEEAANYMRPLELLPEPIEVEPEPQHAIDIEAEPRYSILD
jgi:hypothetical protein